MQTESMNRPIRVKLLSQRLARRWLHQLPGGNPVFGPCEFIFDANERTYDWLVVYDELPARHGEARALRSEPLACPPEHTLLVTVEPSSIKAYGTHYTAQFGCVLTSQEEWALPHRDRIHSQPALRWFYGVGADLESSYDDMARATPPQKTRTISMVYSGKKQRHTLHHRRFRFMREIMRALPDLEVYGRGIRPLDDKAEALDAYRYHIVIENHIGRHHWTEKLADAFLGFTLPFYCGCPNAADYFPAESFIAIDINDIEGSLKTIATAIANDEYERRLPFIVEARRRVMEEYNLFAVLSREIARRHQPGRIAMQPGVLYSRHALRRKNFSVRVQDIFEKARSRLLHTRLFSP